MDSDKVTKVTEVKNLDLLKHMVDLRKIPVDVTVYVKVATVDDLVI